ncbi:hypothetical protein V8F20_002844 [Naviculisporaceae sp. PSN 640]
MSSEKVPFLDLESQHSTPAPSSRQHSNAPSTSSLSGSAYQQRQQELGNQLPSGNNSDTSHSNRGQGTADLSTASSNFSFLDPSPHVPGHVAILRSRDITIRRIHSVVAIIFFVATVHPFTPISWILLGNGGYGAQIADWLVGDVLLAGACYFHFQIASLTDVLVIDPPSFGGLLTRRTVIRNGQVMSSAGIVPSAVYDPAWYWKGVCSVEWTILGLMNTYFAGNEFVRRMVAVLGVMAWWYIGWPATPESWKRWAWGYVRQFWFWMLASRIFRGGWVGIMRFGRG